MSQRKIENFTEYIDVYPEYQMIFLGDTGQGDFDVACKMLVSHPDTLLACFLHEVKDREQAFGYAGYQMLEPSQQKKIVFHHNYVQASLEAWNTGLISNQGLLSVCHQAIRDFQNVKWGQSVKAKEIEFQRLDYLAALESVEKVLNLKISFEIPATPLTINTETVGTEYGPVKIEGFNHRTGYYECHHRNFKLYRHLTRITLEPEGYLSVISETARSSLAFRFSLGTNNKSIE
jgi:hypothetical protein